MGRLAPDLLAAWLDLCCGTGKALIEFPPGSRVRRSERCGESVIYVPQKGGGEVPVFEEPPELMITLARKGRYGMRLVGVEGRPEGR